MSRYKCIQRVGASKQTTLQDILDSADRYPGSWDSIMLFAPADFNDSPEESEKKYQEFADQVNAVKAHGIPVQFNISYVLGHGDFQTKKPAIPRHMVGPEGETCVVSVCPRSAELKKEWLMSSHALPDWRRNVCGSMMTSVSMITLPYSAPAFVTNVSRNLTKPISILLPANS